MRAPCLVLTVLLLMVSSARAGTRSVQSLDALATGSRVRVEGALSMRGSTPFTIMVLEVPGAAEITLTAHNVDIDRQLRSLDGLRVALEGAVLPRFDPEVPRLDVDRCELLTAPGGGNPISGIITIENGACVLSTDEGKRYWIVGDLAPALCQHVGVRVWMVGKKTKRGDGTRPRESTAFTPTGYGVME